MRSSRKASRSLNAHRRGHSRMSAAAMYTNMCAPRCVNRCVREPHTVRAEGVYDKQTPSAVWCTRARARAHRTRDRIQISQPKQLGISRVSNQTPASATLFIIEHFNNYVCLKENFMTYKVFLLATRNAFLVIMFGRMLCHAWVVVL